ncbi:MAG: DUF4230 domain-containing protein [Bacteroidota bacterium]
MKRISLFILVGLIGFLIARQFYKNEKTQETHEDIQVIIQSVKNMNKLIVSEGIFSEVYNFQDAKKYFYDTFEFKKSVIVTVNARVQVLFDLNLMDLEIDSIHKKIIIKSIPKEEITIIPQVKYFDLQQSTFNTFDKEELNKINKKSIDKIKQTAEVSDLVENAKERLVIELKKMYQLSNILGWEVVDETDTQLMDNFVFEIPKF